MMALDFASVYDTLYLLAARDGRREALFGDCASLAHEAFMRSLAGDEYPTVWFELPLTGAARFDLHVALSREALRPKTRFRTGAGNGYNELLAWYADVESGGNGLAFAYDVGKGSIDKPAVHVNINGSPLSDMGRFFELTAGVGAAERYARFASRLPEGWHIWYAGVHPGRAGAPVRVDCFVEPTLREAYAHDLGLLDEDLRSCGFKASTRALHELAEPVLKSPFALELQFDVLGDEEVGPTLGISCGLPRRGALREALEEGGPFEGLMGTLGALDLADDRWRQVPKTRYSRLVSIEGTGLLLCCAPSFVKLRMCEGEPLDAKVYLISFAKTIDTSVLPG